MSEKQGPILMKKMEDMPLKEMAAMTAPASVSDIMRMMGYKHSFVIGNTTARTPSKVLFGEAVTVRSMPRRDDLFKSVQEKAGDNMNMPMNLALDMCKDGKVLVVDSSGLHDTVIGGDVKFSRLENVGAAGLVTDGALRDMDTITGEYSFATYCNSHTPSAGMGNIVQTDVNVPVSVGGASVLPGDYLFGDTDGVLVIPGHSVREILKKAVMKEKLDTFAKELIKKDDVNPGKYYPPTAELKEKFAVEMGLDTKA